MQTLSNAQKSALLLEETLESLRGKPVKSTWLERLRLLREADRLVQSLPQPLQLGKGLGYLLERVSVPVLPQDILLGRVSEKLPDEKEEAFLQDYAREYPNYRPGWLPDGGHITFAWEELLQYGIQGLREQAEKRLYEKRAAGAPEETLVFLEGMALVYSAYQTYIRRYGEAAQAAEQTVIGEDVLHIAHRPPQTFRQAIQLLLLVGHCYSCYAAVNSTLTYGRMDDLLLDYYERDLAAGRLTREEAAYIIADFNCKNNLILGRGEHQMSGGSDNDTGWLRNPTYDTPQYVIIGGYSHRHDHKVNPLTALFAEGIIPRQENPVYVYRRTREDPADRWRVICDKLRQNASLLVYNDETQIPAMLRAGFDREDGLDYTIHGCNWPDIPGKYAVVAQMDARLVVNLLDALGQTPQPQSMEEFYGALAALLRKRIQKQLRDIEPFFTRPGPPLILRCTDCFTSGTIQAATSIYQGGTKYRAVYYLVRHIATAADCLAAVEQLVYREKKLTLTQMAELSADDFAGQPRLLAMCKSAPKFGCDNDLADSHAVRYFTMALDIAQEECARWQASLGEAAGDFRLFNVTITDMRHIYEGSLLPATPDGRRKAAPLSENLSPTRGVAVEGLTALIRSVAKLPFDRVHAGAFNLRVRKDWVKGDGGLTRLQQMLDAYFEEGGMQVQLSVADTEELRQAQRQPDQYRDLMVRITGYSAVFVDMSRQAQEEIIRRDEMGV